MAPSRGDNVDTDTFTCLQCTPPSSAVMVWMGIDKGWYSGVPSGGREAVTMQSRLCPLRWRWNLISQIKDLERWWYSIGNTCRGVCLVFDRWCMWPQLSFETTVDTTLLTIFDYVNNCLHRRGSPYCNAMRQHTEMSTNSCQPSGNVSLKERCGQTCSGVRE